MSHIFLVIHSLNPSWKILSFGLSNGIVYHRVLVNYMHHLLDTFCHNPGLF